MHGEKQLNEIPTISQFRSRAKWEIANIWKSHFGRVPPKQLRKELLIPVTAYKLQEKVQGGLNPRTANRIKLLARSLRFNPETGLDRLSIKPGTRLVREWNGHAHQVTVHSTGYEYSGKLFKSLSQIARMITGTRWSGPLFFGLKGNRKQDSSNGKRN